MSISDHASSNVPASETPAIMALQISFALVVGVFDVCFASGCQRPIRRMGGHLDSVR